MALRIPALTRELVASAARTTSSNSGAILLTDGRFDNFLVALNVSAASGTSPTLDVYIQQSLDGGTTFVDVARFAQQTTTTSNSHYINLASGANNVVAGAVGDATISASAIGTTLISQTLRVKWVVGGTSPSFTFSVQSYRA